MTSPATYDTLPADPAALEVFRQRGRAIADLAERVHARQLTTLTVDVDPFDSEERQEWRRLLDSFNRDVADYTYTHLPARWIERGMMVVEPASVARALRKREGSEDAIKAARLLESQRDSEEVRRALVAEGLSRLWGFVLAAGDTRMPEDIFAELLPTADAWESLYTLEDWPFPAERIERAINAQPVSVVEPLKVEGRPKAPSHALATEGLPLLGQPWEGDRSQWPTITGGTNKGETTFALTLIGSDVARRNKKEIEAAWIRIERLSPIVRHVADLLTENTAASGGGPFQITVNDLLDRMGRRNESSGGYRRRDKELVDDAIHILRDIGVCHLVYTAYESKADREKVVAIQGDPSVAVEPWLNFTRGASEDGNHTYRIWPGLPMKILARAYPNRVAIMPRTEAIDLKFPAPSFLARQLARLVASEPYVVTRYGIPVPRLAQHMGLEVPAIPQKRTKFLRAIVSAIEACTKPKIGEVTGRDGQPLDRVVLDYEVIDYTTGKRWSAEEFEAEVTGERVETRNGKPVRVKRKVGKHTKLPAWRDITAGKVTVRFDVDRGILKGSKALAAKGE